MRLVAEVMTMPSVSSRESNLLSSRMGHFKETLCCSCSILAVKVDHKITKYHFNIVESDVKGGP